MKSSGQTTAADREVGAQAADRGDREDAVDALLDQRAQVGLVVDPVGEDVGVDGAVALDDRGAVLGRRRDDPLAAGADRVGAEDDGQASHRGSYAAGLPR